jgi:hypothetical protein
MNVLKGKIVYFLTKKESSVFYLQFLWLRFGDKQGLKSESSLGNMKVVSLSNRFKMVRSTS